MQPSANNQILSLAFRSDDTGSDSHPFYIAWTKLPEFPFESYVQTNLGAYMLQSQIHGEDDQVPLLPRLDSNR